MNTLTPLHPAVTEIQRILTRNPLCPPEMVYWWAGLPVVAMELRVRDNDIHLGNIRTIEGFERQGWATKVLKLMMSIADRTNCTISGTIQPTMAKPMSVKQLAAWYKKCGFEVKGTKITYYPKT